MGYTPENQCLWGQETIFTQCQGYVRDLHGDRLLFIPSNDNRNYQTRFSLLSTHNFVAKRTFSLTCCSWDILWTESRKKHRNATNRNHEKLLALALSHFCVWRFALLWSNDIGKTHINCQNCAKNTKNPWSRSIVFREFADTSEWSVNVSGSRHGDTVVVHSTSALSQHWPKAVNWRVFGYFSHINSSRHIFNHNIFAGGWSFSALLSQLWLTRTRILRLMALSKQ